MVAECRKRMGMRSRVVHSISWVGVMMHGHVLWDGQGEHMH